jgi:hypothetical protein
MNHDKANQVEVGEGPKAADTALQRIVRSRKAAEAEAPFDIENVSKLLGDLDLGADVGSTEVIDDLGELDFAGEDMLGEQKRAELAEIIKLGETDSKAADAALQRLKRAEEAGQPETRPDIDILLGDLDVGAGEIDGKVIEPLGDWDAPDVDADKIRELMAEVDRLSETDPKAADAALQRFAQAREAREAEALEAKYRSNIGGSVLGDLKVGGDETSEVIEDIGELISAGEDTLAKAEVKDIPNEAPREPTELQVQMRAARARLSGGLDIASDDPLAKDKRRVNNALQKVGRTLSDLPRDWDTLSRTAADGKRSRQSEFHRVLEAGREEMREAERLQELKKRGRPLNYDSLPRDEKDRIDNKARQRRHRDKIPKPPAKLTVTLPIADVGPESLRDTLIKMSHSLDNWALYRGTPTARQLRNPERQKALIRAAAAYARYFGKHHKSPSFVELAKILHCSKDQARRRLDRLKSLYAPGGPWASP